MEVTRDEPGRLAVQVSSGYKSYASHSVLKGINLHVEEASIYGLLGPSGCGKTTLLNIIVGILPLDSGTVTTKVTNCSKLGYMPQELALYNGFTIVEVLSYYGLLYGMTLEAVRRRTEELLKFLHLPSKTKPTDNLSGGQQRRVSLAISLLHDPELLILDEPTVGVDPLLSKSIWDGLLYMSTHKKKTIIITTHYIEEARRADRLGLMRDGVLLAEGSPLSIMSSAACETLEDSFLKLSQQQVSQETNIDEDKSKQIRFFQHLKEPSLFKFHRLFALLLKQYYWMKGNPGSILFIVCLPLVQCIIQYQTVGGDPHEVGIAVYNEELSRDQFCFQINITGCLQEIGLSCRYLDIIKAQQIPLREVGSLEEAKIAVRRSNIWAAMHFPKNFTILMLDRFSNGRDARDESLNTEVSLWVDASDYMVQEILKKKLYNSFSTFLKQYYTDCQWDINEAGIPINFKPPIYGTMDLNFSFASIPPLLILVSFYMPLLYTYSTVLSEKLYGQWDRTIVAGTSMGEILLAQGLIQLILLVIQTVIVIWLEFYVYPNPFLGSLTLIVSLMLITGISGMFLGFLLSLTSKSFLEGAMLFLGIYLITVMVGGSAWPVEGMHKYLKWMYYTVPLALPSEAIRAITNRSWPLSHPVVYMGFISAVAYLFIFFAATLVVVRFQRLGYKASFFKLF